MVAEIVGANVAGDADVIESVVGASVVGAVAVDAGFVISAASTRNVKKYQSND